MYSQDEKLMYLKKNEETNKRDFEEKNMQRGDQASVMETLLKEVNWSSFFIFTPQGARLNE